MSLPKDPRMQMINMMYLVLMALLAINVSAEILKGFRIVQISLEKSNENADEKIAQLHSVFTTALFNDPENEVLQNYANRADKVKEICDGFSGRVEQYLGELENLGSPDAENGEVYINNGKGVSELQQAGNQDISAQYFLLTKEGDDFQAYINDTRSQLLALLDSADKAQMQNTLTLEEAINPPVLEGDTRTWSEDLFDNMPLAAVVTLMEKFRADIKATEIEMLSTLMSKVNKGNWNFDRMETNIVSGGRYLQSGQVFESQIFVSAYSSTLQPEVLIGKLPEGLEKDEFGRYTMIIQKDNPLFQVFDTLDIKNGKGSFRAQSSLGNHDYEGVIHLVNNGKHYWFPFKDHYQVANNAAAVSPTKMNVVYAGLWNPFQISVPGVKDENVTLNAGPSKVRKLGGGKYEVNPSQASGTLQFKLMINNEDGTTSYKDGGEFIAKRVPAPKPKLMVNSQTKYGSQDISVSRFKNLQMSVVKADLEDFLFTGLKFTVKSCDVMYIPKKGDDPYIIENLRGGTISSDSKLVSMIKKAKKGDRIYISNIKISGPNGTEKLNDPVSITAK